MGRNRVMRELQCILDDRDRLKYSEQLVKHLDAAARAKVAIKSHTSEANRLVNVLIEGSEMRPVQCEEIPDYKEGMMRLCRLDTDETLSERRMSDKERNENLFAQKSEGEKSPAGETNEPKGETIAAAGETNADQETPPAPEGETAQVPPDEAAAEVQAEGSGTEPAAAELSSTESGG